jgi:hypothetical protein
VFKVLVKAIETCLYPYIHPHLHAMIFFSMIFEDIPNSARKSYSVRDCKQLPSTLSTPKLSRGGTEFLGETL